MSRKVYIEVTTRIIVNMDEGVEVQEVLDEIGFDFFSNTEGAEVEDTEIVAWGVTDSK